MEIIGILLIAIGLFGFFFGGSPSEPESEVLSKLDELKSSSSVRLVVIDDKKLNFGLVVVGTMVLFL